MKNLTTWRIVLLLSYLGYLLNNIYLYFFIETQLSLTASLFILVLQYIPLIIFLPWLLKPNYKASLFFCLVLMVYFAFSIIMMFEQGAKIYVAIINTLLIVCFFSSSLVLGKLHKA